MSPLPRLDPLKRKVLHDGVVIPAHPLALTAERRLDEQRQRALTRYYLASGAGGLAVGVHTTQFAIRDPRVSLFRPVLELAAGTVRQTIGQDDGSTDRPVVLVAGAIGPTHQAVAEATLARDLGYDAVLLSLGALAGASDDELMAHCERVAEVAPLFGFYLQPAVGGRRLGRSFWQRFAALPNVEAIKIAPFDRYATLDVLHGVAMSGRGREVALYTGNDDSIVADLLFSFRTVDESGRSLKLRIEGGLLGHWAVWTSRAVEIHTRLKRIANDEATVLEEDVLELAMAVTDSNAAIFDPANRFAGCIPGIHEILRRQGLLAGRWTLDTHEDLSPGQLDEIDRVWRAYPRLNDDAFVAANLDAWLA